MRRSKIVILVILLVIVDALLDIITPGIFGSQIDKKFLESLDTSKITYQYTVLETHPTDDETGATLPYFSASIDDSNIAVMITVHKEENSYGPKIQINREWHKYKSLFSYDTVTYITKNNIKIVIIERTNKFRSKNAQLYLEELLSFAKK